MSKKTIIGIVLSAFCVVCRFVPAAAELYASHIYPLISAILSLFASIFPFSLEELTVLAFVALFISILVKAIKKKESFMRWLEHTAIAVMWLIVWLYMGWGNNYFRPGLYQRNGIKQASFEKAQFVHFLEDYSAQINTAALQAQEYDPDELEADIKAFYTESVSEYGYTRLHKWQHAKKPIFNGLYSAVSVQGFVGSFFCESTLNRSLLPHEYPYVLAHEFGHLAGVTSEAEASYWGFAYCRQSQNAAVCYSGYQCILPYILSSAKFLLSEEEYQGWVNTLDEKVIQDYTYSRNYWAQLKVNWIEKLQRWHYNLYLKSNHVTEGIKDYSGVVEITMTMDSHHSQVQTAP